MTIVFALLLLTACNGEIVDTTNDTSLVEPEQATIQPLTSTSVNATRNSSGSEQPTMLQEPDQHGISPTRVRIPAINVDAPIVQKGLNEEREMEVPDNGEDVGWFEPGTMPGNSGNAILAGHVDDRTGPAVFFDLKDLEQGDLIYLTGKDGKELTFEVNKVIAYPKDNAPLHKIFGPSNQRNLNLLTCTGTFDHSIQDHEERLVVYTSLKP
ncbi:class F sortase [Pontibacillus sp. ALD_SL1]|uniref:class F sortase n=1 Tax=Pontibacillus sp. ALD_SL1 TaxID=2777185 RepID=UPI001A959A56|nr:class F sortase [Pontibacillus sp. ALD_SL1]QST00529.1 class F sortase [Pontibacillus sp. ALD_SL1]